MWPILKVLWHICLIISIICLIVTLSVLMYIRAMMSRRVLCFRNFCLTLLLGQIAFVIGLHLNQTACQMIGLMVHLCYMSASVWLALVGLALIALAFADPICNPVHVGPPGWLFSVIGYVPAFVYVAGFSIIDWPAYSKEAPYCLPLEGSFMIVLFIANVLIMSVIAVTIAVYVMFNESGNTSETHEAIGHQTNQERLVYVRTTRQWLLVVGLLTIVCWITGLVVFLGKEVFPDDMVDVFHIAFVMFNGLILGVAVLVMTVFYNKEVNQALYRQDYKGEAEGQIDPIHYTH